MDHSRRPDRGHRTARSRIATKATATPRTTFTSWAALWGYDGNGPRDLALSLLADALGDIATCTTTSQGPKHAACGCWDGLRPLPYLRFTTDLIAYLPMLRPCTLRRWDITTWLLNLADRPVPDLGQPAAGRAQ